MHQARHPLALVLVLVLGAAGCFTEAKRAEPDRVHPDLGRVAMKLVHISGPRVKVEDDAGKRRLEEAVGLASSILGLDAVFFGGDVLANETPATVSDSIDLFASLSGIIAARRYVVIGERERTGALAKDDLLRAFERRKLLPGRQATYSDVPRPGVRAVVVEVAEDGSVPADARKAAVEMIGAAKEDLIIVATDRPPLDRTLQDLFRRDARVKLVLYRAAVGEVIEVPGEPLQVATPALDTPSAPAIRFIDIDGRTCKLRLLGVPGGAPSAEQTATLRPDAPAR